MLKIWGRLTSVNVQKVMLAVRELALPHEFILAGGEHGVVDTTDYAERNPNRQVPVIDDGGFVLWESNAIVRYLSARYGVGSLWTEDLGLRADADRWMDWQATEWQPAMVPAFKGLVRTPEDKRDRAAIDASMQRANARADPGTRAAGPRVHRRPSAEHGRHRAGGLGAPLAGPAGRAAADAGPVGLVPPHHDASGRPGRADAAAGMIQPSSAEIRMAASHTTGTISSMRSSDI